jgi:hypothetical protein
MECTICNYTAKTKGNYQKHCNTAKHNIKEQKLKGFGNTRNKPQEIIEHLNESLLEVERRCDIKIEQLIESYEDQLCEKERTIQAKINIEMENNKLKKTLKEMEIIDHWGNILVIDIYNENQALKAKIDQMEKQLIKTIDISGNYVIGRKLI